MSMARRRASDHGSERLLRSDCITCHLSSHSSLPASSESPRRSSSSAFMTRPMSVSATPHMCMMRAVSSSGHRGSPTEVQPQICDAAAYTWERNATCICQAVRVLPSAICSGTRSVRSCDTVCMASTGLARVRCCNACAVSKPAASSAPASHTTMAVVPSLRTSGTSMRLASPAITWNRRNCSAAWDSSRVLTIGRSNVVCNPIFEWKKSALWDSWKPSPSDFSPMPTRPAPVKICRVTA